MIALADLVRRALEAQGSKAELAGKGVAPLTGEERRALRELKDFLERYAPDGAVHNAEPAARARLEDVFAALGGVGPGLDRVPRSRLITSRVRSFLASTKPPAGNWLVDGMRARGMLT